MEDLIKLTTSSELTEIFGLTNPNVVCFVTNQMETTMEAEVLIPPQGMLAYLYDECKLMFTFRKNTNIFTNKEIAYTGRVSLYTFRNTGAPNPKVKTIPLTYPSTTEPLLLTVGFNNVINLAPIKK